MKIHDHPIKKTIDTVPHQSIQEEPIADDVSGLSSFLAVQRSLQKPSRETLTPNVVLQLQRTIGNRAVQRLIAGQKTNVPTSATRTDVRPRSSLITQYQSEGSIQRDFEGDVDPVDEFTNNPDTKSLMYGLSSARGKTLARGGLDKSISPKTIDEYNLLAGINDALGGKAHLGVIAVRQALESPTSWDTYLPPPSGVSPEELSNPDLSTWKTMLVNNKDKVGLYDLGSQAKRGLFGLGGKKGIRSIKSKNRLTKNMRDANSDSENLTPELINHFFRPDQMPSTAADESAEMTEDTQFALADWSERAFFRRTSKLGVDFATKSDTDDGLDANIHFNTAAIVDYDKSKSSHEQTITHGGMSQLSNKKLKNERPITVSEYRYIKKLIKKGKLDKSKINFYSEF